MLILDKSMKINWENHLRTIQNDIDLYISSYDRPPYVEHDLDLDDWDDFDAIPVKGLAQEPVFSSHFTEEETSFTVDDYLKQQSETFSQMLLRLIDQKNLKDSQVYKDANIDRRLFSKIRGDMDYIPSKKTVICFCMALQLDLTESKKLLEAAGYALSTSSRFDLIIMYLLENKEYNVIFANIVLERYGENTLTR